MTAWKKIETLCFNYIWDGKPDKIKRNTLIGHYKDRGYRMIDLKTKIMTTKCCWILSYKNIAGNWRGYLTEALPDQDVQYFVRCNIAYKEIPIRLRQHRIISAILLLDYWCINKYQEKMNSTEEVLNQNIWLNSNIKINDITLYHQQLVGGGVMWLVDIINQENNQLLTYDEFTSKFGVRVPFTYNYRIIKSIFL